VHALDHAEEFYSSEIADAVIDAVEGLGDMTPTIYMPDDWAPICRSCGHTPIEIDELDDSNESWPEPDLCMLCASDRPKAKKIISENPGSLQ
jgi:hypothetical protein